MAINMNNQLATYVGNEQGLLVIEQIIFKIGDAFNIRIQWENDEALLVGLCTLAGGMIGGLAGGRLGAAIGAGVGSLAGVTTTHITLRELWIKAKETLIELFFIVINFLRRFDAVDYIQAIEIVFSTYTSKKELALAIVSFLAQKLSREVICSLSNSSAVDTCR